MSLPRAVLTKLETVLTNIVKTERGRFSHIGMWRDVGEILLHVMFMFDII